MTKISTCSATDIQMICSGLNQFNFENVPQIIQQENCGNINLVAKDSNELVQGGILGSVGYYGGLMIKTLWVNNEFRHQGIGTQLLQQIEQEAREKGATTSFLDTFSFQAKDFYLRQGYSIYGTVDGFPKGHDWYYLKKEL